MFPGYISGGNLVNELLQDLPIEQVECLSPKDGQQVCKIIRYSAMQ
jgi:hypothetical protein